MEKSPFEEAKPRTAKGEARRREEEIMRNIDMLMQTDLEDAFKAILVNKYGLTPGSQRYEAALAAWREGQS